MYLAKGDISEEEQFEILKNAILINNNKPIVIRTFDLGGEKLSNLLPHNKEKNPALGLRAIRYSLRHEDFFKTIKSNFKSSYFWRSKYDVANDFWY